MQLQDHVRQSFVVSLHQPETLFAHWIGYSSFHHQFVVLLYHFIFKHQPFYENQSFSFRKFQKNRQKNGFFAQIPSQIMIIFDFKSKKR